MTMTYNLNDKDGSLVSEEKRVDGTFSEKIIDSAINTIKVKDNGDDSSFFNNQKILSEEEKRLVRKLDIRIMILLCLWELTSRFDGGSVLPNAKLVGLMTDLNLTEEQYRWCLSAPYVALIALSMPISLVLRKWRPAIFVGLFALIWGGATMMNAAVKNFPGLLVLQIIPGVCATANSTIQIYYVSLWYRRDESAQRFGWAAIAGAIGSSIRGLIAFGITEIPTSDTVHSWQWLFIIFGISSVVIGVLCLLILPDKPESALFLTKEERQLAIDRVLTEREISLAAYSWSWKQVVSVVTDWKLYFYFIIFAANTVSVSGGKMNLPEIIDEMGNWSKPVSLALTTPPHLVPCFTIYLISWLSDKYLQRAYFVVTLYLILAFGLLLIMFVPEQQIGVRYFGICIFMIGYNGAFPIRNVWAADNFSGLTRRAVATGILFVADAAGYFIGSQAYFDPPRYMMGHTIALCCIALGIVTVLALRITLYNINKNRNTIQQNVEKREQAFVKYGGENIIGDRHPDYRYSL